MSAIEWICPYCNTHTTITEHNRALQLIKLHAANFDRAKAVQADMIRCPNEKCHAYTLKVSAGDSDIDVQGQPAVTDGKTWSLIPEDNAKPFPEYIPEKLREDYREACLLRERSPKAAASLARRCLQGILRDFYKIRKRSLAHELKALKGKVEPVVWKAVDSVRNYADLGRHMEKDVNLITDVDAKEPELLINLIERLFKESYIDRFEREREMQTVIELAAIKKEEDEKDRAEAAPGSRPAGVSSSGGTR